MSLMPGHGSSLWGWLSISVQSFLTCTDHEALHWLAVSEGKLTTWVTFNRFQFLINNNYSDFCMPPLQPANKGVSPYLITKCNSNPFWLIFVLVLSLCIWIYFQYYFNTSFLKMFRAIAFIVFSVNILGLLTLR